MTNIIDSEKLNQVALMAGVSEVTAMEWIGYDWANESEHLEWVRTASASEIASWIRVGVESAR